MPLALDNPVAANELSKGQALASGVVAVVLQ